MASRLEAVQVQRGGFAAVAGPPDWRPTHGNGHDPVYFADLDGNGLPDFVRRGSHRRRRRIRAVVLPAQHRRNGPALRRRG